MIINVCRCGDFLSFLIREDERDFYVLINIHNILDIEIDEKIVTILLLDDVEHQYYYTNGINIRLLATLDS